MGKKIYLKRVKVNTSACIDNGRLCYFSDKTCYAVKKVRCYAPQTDQDYIFIQVDKDGKKI